VSDRPRVLVDLGVELDRAAQRVLAGEGRAKRAGRLRRWRALPVVLVVLLAGGATALASGLFSPGAPVNTPTVFTSANTGLGVLVPDSLKLLPIRTADPAGGPPWGIRIFTTTRGAGCVQVGRVVDGRLVALGIDGAFSNDGEAHALQPSTAIQMFDCSLLDAYGKFVNSVTMYGQTASAAWWFGSRRCVPNGTPRTTSNAHPACSRSQERDLYFGLLGPDAKSVTYTLAGKSHTQPTLGPQGAYLLVLPAAKHPRILGFGGITSDDVPVYSPITTITFHEGTVCHLQTARHWIVGFHACDPALDLPLGYVRPAPPTAAQIAAPLAVSYQAAHTRSVSFRGRTFHVPTGPQVTVSFHSRIPITNLRASYEIDYHDASTPRGVINTASMNPPQAPQFITVGEANLGFLASTSDVAAGGTVTGSISGAFGPHAPAFAKLNPGEVIHGTVVLRYSTGPSVHGAMPTAKIPVANFTFTIP
jgi:hypothetical protein